MIIISDDFTIPQKVILLIMLFDEYIRVFFTLKFKVVFFQHEITYRTRETRYICFLQIFKYTYLTSKFYLEHYNATIKGGIKGAEIGLGITLGLSLIAQRYSPAFRKLTLPIKAFLVSSGTSAATIILAEQAGLKYERNKYGYYEPEKSIPSQYKTSLQKTKDFISENRYSVATSAWALTIVGSLVYTYKNK